MTAGCPGGTSKAMKTSRKKRSVAAPASDPPCILHPFPFEADGNAISYRLKKARPCRFAAGVALFGLLRMGIAHAVFNSLHFFKLSAFNQFNSLHFQRLFLRYPGFSLHFQSPVSSAHRCRHRQGITPSCQVSSDGLALFRSTSCISVRSRTGTDRSCPLWARAAQQAMRQPCQPRAHR